MLLDCFLSGIAIGVTVPRVSTFGQLVKALREARTDSRGTQMSQAKLARAAGLSQATIHAIEADKSLPSVHNARQVAQALGLPSLTELIARWEGIELPKNAEGLKPAADTADTSNRGEANYSPREITTMIDRRLDRFERALLGMYTGLKDRGRETCEQFVERVRVVAGEIMAEDGPGKKRKNKGA
jgi:DNA-binding XRE family transcriptional regulator